MKCTLSRKAAFLLLGSAAVLAGMGSPAEAQVGCSGHLNISYISGPAFGIDGDVYRVRIGLGSGSISGGPQNVLLLSTVRFFLDCTNSGLPGCTDDGNVVSYVGNITTTCGTAQPNLWTAAVTDDGPGGGAVDFVDFTAESPVVIPPNQPPGFCTMSFDIMVASSFDARDDLPYSPNRVEQVVYYRVAMCDNGLPSSASQSGAINLCPVCDDNSLCTTDECDSQTGCIFTLIPNCTDCGGAINVRYDGSAPYGTDGAVYRATVSLGSGTIPGGTSIILRTVRLGLDCESSGLPACTDDGNIIHYVGNVTTNCGTGDPQFWTPSFPDSNTVDFTASTPVVIPPNIATPPGLCTLAFDVAIANTSDARDDRTPNAVEEVLTYSDATCDNGEQSVVVRSAAIPLCPVCDDHSVCTTESCNDQTGRCTFTPVVACDDHDVCTVEYCESQTGECTYISIAEWLCDDDNRCTDDHCDALTGCYHTGNAGQPCNDGSYCTLDDTCTDNGQCVGTLYTLCNDYNACTHDSCVGNGCAYDPGARNGYPCVDAPDLPTDCAHPACLAGACVGNLLPDDTEPGCGPAPLKKRAGYRGPRALVP